MTQAQAQAAPQTQGMTVEQAEQLKAQLRNTLGDAYNQFLGKLTSIPMNGNLIPSARNYLDTGFLWLREAINALDLGQLVVAPVQPVDAPAAPAEDAAPSV